MTNSTTGQPGRRAGSPVTVLVYSNDPEVREAVVLAVGRRPAPDVGPIRWLEAGSQQEVLAVVDQGGADVVILDGEARPTGGMGLCRQLKFELADCPAVCVLTARVDDRWLASWSLADAVLTHPLDPVQAADVVAEVVRSRSDVQAVGSA